MFMFNKKINLDPYNKNFLYKNFYNTEKPNNNLPISNYGLNNFIKKTYLWTGCAITSSIGISLLGNKFNFINPIETGFIISIGGIIGIHSCEPGLHQEIYVDPKTNKTISILYTSNSIPRILSYCLLVSGMGISMIPIFNNYPNAIIPAFIGSTSVFGGASYYALTTKDQELSYWGSTLYSGLSGLVSVSLLGIGSTLLFGHNFFGDLTQLISLYGGIPLFTGLIAYDTYKATKKYQERDPDHLACSVDLYLDFMNLFSRLIKIISKTQSDNNNKKKY